VVVATVEEEATDAERYDVTTDASQFWECKRHELAIRFRSITVEVDMIRIVIAALCAVLMSSQVANAFMRNGCTEDYQKYCSGVGERSARAACLKANWSRLSPDCKAMFKGN
jgi:hypothetical protein